MIYLITGGAGSLGRRLVTHLLRVETNFKPTAIRVFDNCENSLVRFERNLLDPEKKARFLLGDIRDKDRLIRAMENVDICIHCAAQKHVHIAEFNPFESIQTNVIGTQNCIDAALTADIDIFLYISSDKAVQAVGTYGRCKALSESLTLDANNYKGDRRTKLSVARPPNYINSDGSVFEVWKEEKARGLPLSVTSKEMTRHFMTFEEIIKFLTKCLVLMEGGEIFVPTGSRNLRIMDLAKKIGDNIQITGMRKGEKLHEMLIDPAEINHAKHINGMWVIKQ